MLWLRLLANVVAARVLLATLRFSNQTTLTRALLLEVRRAPNPGWGTSIPRAGAGNPLIDRVELNDLEAA